MTRPPGRSTRAISAASAAAVVWREVLQQVGGEHDVEGRRAEAGEAMPGCRGRPAARPPRRTSGDPRQISTATRAGRLHVVDPVTVARAESPGPRRAGARGQRGAAPGPSRPFPRAGCPVKCASWYARHRLRHTSGRFRSISMPSNGALVRAPWARTQRAVSASPSRSDVCRSRAEHAPHLLVRGVRRAAPRAAATGARRPVRRPWPRRPRAPAR